MRATANGGLFGYAPNVAAAGDATIPLDAGSSSAPNWLDRYTQNLALQNQRDQAGKAQYPTTMVGGMLGNALSPAKVHEADKRPTEIKSHAVSPAPIPAAQDKAPEI